VIFLATVLLYFAVINVKFYRTFRTDKKLAIDKGPRTPEATQLFHARVDGWIGARFAPQKLRRKSYKQPFGRHINSIGAVRAASIITFSLILGFLARIPTQSPLTLALQTAKLDVPTGQHAGGLVAISPRPSVRRP